MGRPSPLNRTKRRKKTDDDYIDMLMETAMEVLEKANDETLRRAALKVIVELHQNDIVELDIREFARILYNEESSLIQNESLYLFITGTNSRDDRAKLRILLNPKWQMNGCVREFFMRGDRETQIRLLTKAIHLAEIILDRAEKDASLPGDDKNMTCILNLLGGSFHPDDLKRVEKVLLRAAVNKHARSLPNARVSALRYYALHMLNGNLPPNTDLVDEFETAYFEVDDDLTRGRIQDAIQYIHQNLGRKVQPFSTASST